MGFKIEFGGDKGDAEERGYERQEIAIQKAMMARVYAVFFTLIGGTPYQIGRPKILKAGTREFRHGKHKYIVQPEKVKMRRIKVYGIRWIYVAVLEYRIGYSLPLATYESAIEQDADALDRVTNERNIATLLPNPNQRLELITLVALIMALAFGGGLMYFMVNEDAADEVQNFIRPRPRDSDTGGPITVTPGEAGGS